MAKIKQKIKDLTWYLSDKLIVPTTTLLGVGAARAIDDKSILEGIVQAARFPYDLLIGKGFVPEVAKTFLDLADNVLEHPYETIGCIAGGYLVGKITRFYSERKRLKAKYGTIQKTAEEKNPDKKIKEVKK